MKLTKITPQILLLTCKTKKELTLSFFRVQEFYEAQHDQLRGKKFDTFKFLDALMEDSGKIKYFSTWSGFNFPSTIYNKWYQLNPDSTSYEMKFISLLEKATSGLQWKSKNFYVIAVVEGDDDSIDHEIAHAMFFLDNEYREHVTALIRDLPKKFHKYLNAILLKFGYNDVVIVDEINAYLATSSYEYLRKRLKLSKKDLAPIGAFQDAFTDHKQKL